jgi:hypothetical protein
MSHRAEHSIDKTAFSCPYCSVFTTQFWYDVFADSLKGEDPHPKLLGDEDRRLFQEATNISEKAKSSMFECIDKIQSGLIFLDRKLDTKEGYSTNNIHLSRCYHCKEIAVWVHDKLVFPGTKSGVVPNRDLPADISRDFEEAREIVNFSPRGAAALLRLCVQKLCLHLGEKGKDLNQDIASLVSKGLNQQIQQSLDIVRVIGNAAVHPGVLNLKDDRQTALVLFEILNSIADQMISQPKAARNMYAKLPEDKRKAIEARDRKAPQS